MVHGAASAKAYSFFHQISYLKFKHQSIITYKPDAFLKENFKCGIPEYERNIFTLVTETRTNDKKTTNLR